MGALITRSNAASMAHVRSSSFFWSKWAGIRILRPLIASRAAISSSGAPYCAQTNGVGGAKEPAPILQRRILQATIAAAGFAAAPADADGFFAFAALFKNRFPACHLRRIGHQIAVRIGESAPMNCANIGAGFPSGWRHWRRRRL